MTPAEIKEARQSLGLTGGQLAPLLGYSARRAEQAMSEIESGKTMNDAARRLLQAYLDGYRPADWPVTAEKNESK